MNPERRQPNIEAANDDAAFPVLETNEAAEVGVEQRMTESQAAELVAALMKAATEVNLKQSNPEAGKSAFEAAA